ncbi:hypothetical protein [Bradyrhizobium sp. ERR14]|uniref:hypothetical protein n=1 Tax=Bradyrhizobium sp. ERR14 TaxID=2663837 RepID=UPI001AED38A0|nr:hypothetical protein [Bradyrhizobium sp. ERR14]
MAGNELHEHFASLFGMLFGKSDRPLAQAAWHSLVNDRAPREMLRSVAHLKLGETSTAYQELNRILEQTNQQVAGQKNLDIHMPVFIFHNPDDSLEVLPFPFAGNRTAAGFWGKDLLKNLQSMKCGSSN